MASYNFARLPSRQRKWYIQPIDTYSAQAINRLVPDAPRLKPSAISQSLNKTTYILRCVDKKFIDELMEKTSLDALISFGSVKDFGINFSVFMKNWGDDEPHFCFKTTSEIRSINAKRHLERPFVETQKLCVVPGIHKERTFVIRHTDKNSEKIPDVKIPQDILPKTEYRISTRQPKVAQYITDVLLKDSVFVKPIIGVDLCDDGKEAVWSVSPSHVLLLKGYAKTENFLFFSILKKDKGGEYTQIARYPSFEQ